MIVFKVTQKSPNISANLVGKIAPRNFLKMFNLVTLTLNQTLTYFCNLGIAQLVTTKKFDRLCHAWDGVAQLLPRPPARATTWAGRADARMPEVWKRRPEVGPVDPEMRADHVEAGRILSTYATSQRRETRRAETGRWLPFRPPCWPLPLRPWLPSRWVEGRKEEVRSGVQMGPWRIRTPRRKETCPAREPWNQVLSC